jgi:hypothetical protein
VALTITMAVLFAYAVLFVLILVAAIFVPSGYVQSTLQHRVVFSDYAALAWMASSLATVAGALGSILEDEETMREEGAYAFSKYANRRGAKAPVCALLSLLTAWARLRRILCIRTSQSTPSTHFGE